VGAGTFSTVPVLDAVQTAVSVHRLRVAYWLETPDFQLGGSYPPVVTWSPGPRLRWTEGLPQAVEVLETVIYACANRLRLIPPH